MNEELLKTPIVKSSIKRYLEERLNLEQIEARLEYIHMIKVSKGVLLNAIKEIEKL